MDVTSGWYLGTEAIKFNFISISVSTDRHVAYGVEDRLEFSGIFSNLLNYFIMLVYYVSRLH